MKINKELPSWTHYKALVIMATSPQREKTPNNFFSSAKQLPCLSFPRFLSFICHLYQHLSPLIYSLFFKSSFSSVYFLFFFLSLFIFSHIFPLLWISPYAPIFSLPVYFLSLSFSLLHNSLLLPVSPSLSYFLSILYFPHFPSFLSSHSSLSFDPKLFTYFFTIFFPSDVSKLPLK